MDASGHPPKTVLLAGATGLVGRHVLDLLLADSRVGRVVAPSRRPLLPHPKLQDVRVDYDALPVDAAWWAVDAVICTLGTTIKVAGSQEAFRRIDHDYPLQVATLARRHGAGAYALNSAKGADAGSRIFYSRVKGELERDLATLDFPSLTFVRPGLIGGERAETRTGEAMASVVLRALGAVLPRAWRINPASRIAAALVEAALQAPPGQHVVESAQLA
ncbi:Rossmann-fold NAD(P)-binding domain-containing protein [Pseudoxanthomonas daejeonensis]|uniref:NAD-dependent dehydratase n=1 Tax=Pseudoxanthomonas daejeonensis TaxID=266062 RepID=A0ABQ6Z7R4_9GAMM|nr:NAD-dependent dehydratase [Pseudoxanthomonas daejeonensis]KAF1695071.1 NAD-dependent dehydratase [Pseudoxanthomonas daejeonensis]